MANDIGWLRRKQLFDQFGRSGVPPDNFGNLPNVFEPQESLNSPINFGEDETIAPNYVSGASAQMPQEPTDDFQSYLDQLNKLYTPETKASNRFGQLLDAPPEMNEPSILRKLAAGAAGMGNIRMKRAGGTEEAEKVLHAPYYRDAEDWKLKADQFSKAAQLENTANANERYVTGNLINAKTQADRIAAGERKTRDEIASKERIATQKTDLEREKMNGAKFDFDGEYVIVTRADGTVYNSGVASTAFNPMERARLQATTAVQVANIGAASREKVAETGAASREIYNIPDPADPSKQIAVRINPQTNKVTRVTLDDQPVGPAGKPGAPGKGVQPDNIQVIQNTARETLNVLNELLDDKDKLKPEATSAIGKSRMLGLQHIPASQTRTADAKITRLKNRITIGLIAEMKAQSKTGATGFGQMNMRELDVLEQAASNLDPTLSEEAFAAELKRIKEKLNLILAPADGLTPTTTRPLTAREKIEKYGAGVP